MPVLVGNFFFSFIGAVHKTPQGVLAQNKCNNRHTCNGSLKGRNCSSLKGGTETFLCTVKSIKAYY